MAQAVPKSRPAGSRRLRPSPAAARRRPKKPPVPRAALSPNAPALPRQVSALFSGRAFTIRSMKTGSAVTNGRRTGAGPQRSTARPSRSCWRPAGTAKSRRARWPLKRAPTCSSPSKRWRCAMPSNQRPERAPSRKGFMTFCMGLRTWRPDSTAGATWSPGCPAGRPGCSPGRS